MLDIHSSSLLILHQHFKNWYNWIIHISQFEILDTNIVCICWALKWTFFLTLNMAFKNNPMYNPIRYCSVPNPIFKQLWVNAIIMCTVHCCTMSWSAFFIFKHRRYFNRRACVFVEKIRKIKFHDYSSGTLNNLLCWFTCLEQQIRVSQMGIKAIF